MSGLVEKDTLLKSTFRTSSHNTPSEIKKEAELSNPGNFSGDHHLDKAVSNLTESKILDEDLWVGADKADLPFPPHAKETLIDCVNLLTSPFLVRGKLRGEKKEESSAEEIASAEKGYTFEKNISLGRLLDRFRKYRIEIVGGKGFWLLRHNLEALLKTLGVENPASLLTPEILKEWATVPSDLDLRILVPSASGPQDLRNLCNDVKSFLAEELSAEGGFPSDKMDLVHNTGLIKLHVEFNKTNRNRFSTVTIGDHEGNNAECIFVKDLERKSLFILDALRFPINGLLDALATANWDAQAVIDAIKKGKFGSEMAPCSDFRNCWQPFIDRFLGLTRATEPHKIDLTGCEALLTGYAKGRRCFQESLEEILFDTLKNSKREKSIHEFIGERLQKCLLNHHLKDSPTAAFVMTFKMCSLLQKEAPGAIYPLWAVMRPQFFRHSNRLIKDVDVLVQQSKCSFAEISALVQAHGFFSLCSASPSKDFFGSLLMHKKKDNAALQINVEGKCLLLPFEPSAAFELVKDCKKVEILSAFSTLFRLQARCCVPDSQSTLGRLHHLSVFNTEKEKLKKRAYLFLEKEEEGFKALGISLLLACGVSSFKVFIDYIPYMLSYPHLMKSIKALPLEQNENRVMEAYEKYQSAPASKTSLMNWANALLEAEDEDWSLKAKNLWSTFSPTVDESLAFAIKLSRSRPDLALKLLQSKKIPGKLLFPTLHEICEICKNGRKNYRVKDLPLLMETIPALLLIGQPPKELLNSLQWLGEELLEHEQYGNFFSLIANKYFRAGKPEFWLRCWENVMGTPHAVQLWQTMEGQKIFNPDNKPERYFNLLLELLQAEIKEERSTVLEDIFREWAAHGLKNKQNRVNWLQQTLWKEVKKLPREMVQSRLKNISEWILTRQPQAEELDFLLDLYEDLNDFAYILPSGYWQDLIAALTLQEDPKLRLKAWKILEKWYFTHVSKANEIETLQFFQSVIKLLKEPEQAECLLEVRNRFCDAQMFLTHVDSALIEFFSASKSGSSLQHACRLMSGLIAIAPSVQLEKKQKSFSALIKGLSQMELETEDPLLISIDCLIENIKANKEDKADKEEQQKFIFTFLSSIGLSSSSGLVDRSWLLLKHFLEKNGSSALNPSCFSTVNLLVKHAFNKHYPHSAIVIKECLQSFALKPYIKELSPWIASFFTKYEIVLAQEETGPLKTTLDFVLNHLRELTCEQAAKEKIQNFVFLLFTEIKKREIGTQEKLFSEIYRQIGTHLDEQQANEWKINLCKKLLETCSDSNEKRGLLSFLRPRIDSLLLSQKNEKAFISLLNLFENMIGLLLERKDEEGIKEAQFMLHAARSSLFDKLPTILQRCYEKIIRTISKGGFTHPERLRLFDALQKELIDKMSMKNPAWNAVSASVCAGLANAIIKIIKESKIFQEKKETFQVLTEFLPRALLNHYFENAEGLYLSVLKNLKVAASSFIMDKEFIHNFDSKFVTNISWLMTQAKAHAKAQVKTQTKTLTRAKTKTLTNTKKPLNDKEMLSHSRQQVEVLGDAQASGLEDRKSIVINWIQKLCELNSSEALTSAHNAYVLAKTANMYDHRNSHEMQAILFKMAVNLPAEDFEKISRKWRMDFKSFFSFCGWGGTDYHTLTFGMASESFMNKVCEDCFQKNETLLIKEILKELSKDKDFVDFISNGNLSKKCVYFWIKWAKKLLDHPSTSSKIICELITGLEKFIDGPNFLDTWEFFLDVIKKTYSEECLSNEHTLIPLLERINRGKKKLTQGQISSLNSILIHRFEVILANKRFNYYRTEFKIIKMMELNEEQETRIHLKAIEEERTLKACKRSVDYLCTRLAKFEKFPKALHDQLETVVFSLLAFLRETGEDELYNTLSVSYQSVFNLKAELFQARISSFKSKEADRDLQKILDVAEQYSKARTNASWKTALETVKSASFKKAIADQQTKTFLFLNAAVQYTRSLNHLERAPLLKDVVFISEKIRTESSSFNYDPKEILTTFCSIVSEELFKEGCQLALMKIDRYSLPQNLLFFQSVAKLLRHGINLYFRTTHLLIAEVLLRMFPSFGTDLCLAALWVMYYAAASKLLMSSKEELYYSEFVAADGMDATKEIAETICEHKKRLLNISLIALPWTYAGLEEVNGEFERQISSLFSEIFHLDMKAYREMEDSFWERFKLYLFFQNYSHHMYGKINKSEWTRALSQIHSSLDVKNVNMEKANTLMEFECVTPRIEQLISSQKIIFYKSILETLSEATFSEDNAKNQNAIKERKIFLLEKIAQL